MTNLQAREMINNNFKLHLEKATGHIFEECCLTKTAMSIMGTKEAIEAVEALNEFTLMNKEFDPEYNAWFAEIPVLAN